MKNKTPIKNKVGINVMCLKGIDGNDGLKKGVKNGSRNDTTPTKEIIMVNDFKYFLDLKFRYKNLLLFL